MMWFIVAILVVLFGIAYMVYTLPAESLPKKRRKEKPAPITTMPGEKDWKEIAERWERKNNALLGDVEKLSMNEKKLHKEIDNHKRDNKEMLDKMALEKSWREKEQGNLDKVKNNEKALKDQIIKTEKDLEKEHSARLSIERELQDVKIKFESVQEEKRQATTNAASLSTTVKHMQNQIRDLMRDNEGLKQKREDIQWVAKSEYDELLKKYEAGKKA